MALQLCCMVVFCTTSVNQRQWASTFCPLIPKQNNVRSWNVHTLFSSRSPGKSTPSLMGGGGGGSWVEGVGVRATELVLINLQGVFARCALHGVVYSVGGSDQSLSFGALGIHFNRGIDVDLAPLLARNSRTRNKPHTRAALARRMKSPLMAFNFQLQQATHPEKMKIHLWAACVPFGNCSGW